jgi:O-methyltransferase involved in polyketide biosynthesis
VRSRSSIGSTTTSATLLAALGGMRSGWPRLMPRYAALARHPSGTVVALGEGLETQVWRVDNGRMRWVSVDLPETLELRHKLLPDRPRQRSHAGSALEMEWLDDLDPATPVLVTAQGLFVYFQREQVHELIAAMACRLPGASLIFDVVPERLHEMVRRFPTGRAARRAACGCGSSIPKNARQSARSLAWRALMI